jgi:hypothetical protein
MDVGGAVGRAIESTRAGLFRPFRAGSWLQYGLVFFLASFVDPTFGGFPNAQWPRPGTHRHHHPFAWPHPLHATWIVAGAAVALTLFSVVAVVLAWVGCRGSMMSFRAVARRDAGGALGAFRELREPANALFRSYVAVWLASAVLVIPVAAIAVTTALGMHAAGASDDAVVGALLPYGAVAGAIFGAAMVVLFFVRSFVAPILFHLRCTARDAWRRTFVLVRENFASVLLFAVARFALALVVGFASTVATFATCCIGGLPVIHQTILAPLFFFDRAFRLHVLASVGGEYANAI